MTDTQKATIAKITGLVELSFIMPNVASTSEGYILSVDALEKLADAAAKANELESIQAALTETESKLTALQTKFNETETALTTANATIKTLQEENDVLKNEDAGGGSNPIAGQDPNNPKGKTIISETTARAMAILEANKQN